MTDSMQLDQNHPLRVAWSEYKTTREYENLVRWAADPAHVEGSLWGAFLKGYYFIAERWWRQMETAPKSTSEETPHGHLVHAVYLLGFCPEEGASPESCMNVIWWEPHYQKRRGKDHGAWVNELGNVVHPTGWMPLPPPPWGAV
jgi:hypothetical protein